MGIEITANGMENNHHTGNPADVVTGPPAATETPKPKIKAERFHFLDGLRGLATTTAVIHHTFTAFVMRWLSDHGMTFLGNMFAYFTMSGVELFFVMSGIVVLRPFLRRQKKINIGDYFRRRIKRIYPTYFTALMFGAAVVWFNNTFPTWYNEHGLRMQFTWMETLKEAAIISFDGRFYNLSWWSLQIEMAFYLMAPLIVFIFPTAERINNRRIVLTIFFTLAATLLLQLLLDAYIPSIYSTTHYVFSIGKSIEYPICFLLGIFVAIKDLTLKHARAFLICGVVCIVGGLLLVSKSLIFFSILHTGYGFLYAGVIVMGFHFKSLRNVLSTPFMIWLGERSYSLFSTFLSVFYLTDNLVSHFVSGRNAYYGLLTRGLGIPFAVFIAMLLFHFVERKQAHGLITGDIFWPWQLYKLKQNNVELAAKH